MMLIDIYIIKHKDKLLYNAVQYLQHTWLLFFPSLYLQHHFTVYDSAPNMVKSQSYHSIQMVVLRMVPLEEGGRVMHVSVMDDRAVKMPGDI